jgi:phosphoglycolate phosphatase
MQLELLVFDLDGTLIDSKLDLALSVNATRADLKLPPLPHETIFSYVGNGAPALIRRALGEGASEEQFQRSLQFFLDYYRAHMLENTRLYPGVRETLDRLAMAGVQMAVLTNKPVRFSRDLIRGLGLADRFSAVYGGNSFDTKKPNPEGLRHVMAELHAAPQETMVVGDSGIDVQTARCAGAWSCGVTYGFQPETFADNPPDFLVNTPAELLKIVENARQGGLSGRPSELTRPAGGGGLPAE